MLGGSGAASTAGVQVTPTHGIDGVPAQAPGGTVLTFPWGPNEEPLSDARALGSVSGKTGALTLQPWLPHGKLSRQASFCLLAPCACSHLLGE